jgi:heme oxygenase
MATSNIKCSVAGSIIYNFTNLDDLTRFQEVLRRGLEDNNIFNEDIQDIVDDIEKLLINVQVAGS